MNGMAIRHPKRGKAHRAVPLRQWPIENTVEHARACDPWLHAYGYEVVPAQDVAPEDRCKRCWAPAAT